MVGLFVCRVTFKRRDKGKGTGQCCVEEGETRAHAGTRGGYRAA